MKVKLPIYHLMDILYAYGCSFYSNSISSVFKKILKIYLPNADIKYFNSAESEGNISYIFIDNQDISAVDDLSKLIFVQRISMYDKSYNFIVILRPKNLLKLDTKLVLDYICNLADAIIKNIVDDLSINLDEKSLVAYLNNKQDNPPSLYDIICIIIKIYMMVSLASHAKNMDVYTNAIWEIVLENYLKINKSSSKRIKKILSNTEFIKNLIYNPLTTISYIIGEDDFYEA